MRGYPRSKHSAIRHVSAVCVVAAMLLPPVTFAQAVEPTITHRAKEFSTAGALTSVEGTTDLALSLGGEYYVRMGKLTTGFGAGATYRRVSSLDVFDVEALARIYFCLGARANYLSVGIGGGPRQEWLGSFSQVRYPFGADLGFKVMISERVAWNASYRFRRVLNDPVANFNESQVVFGFGVFFDN